MPGKVRTRRAINAQRLTFSRGMPASHTLGLDLRPATLDDVVIVADLEAARDPDDPRDPQMLRFWWTGGSLNQVAMRLVGMREGSAVVFVGATHERWDALPERFGSIRVVLSSDLWSESDYSHLIGKAEDWLESEGAETAVTRVREDFAHELDALRRIGYREVRRQNFSELDLVAHRDELLATAAQQRRLMQAEGVQLLTLNEDKDPDRMAKLHEMMVAAERDIPTTVPFHSQSFEAWRHATFDDPGSREDRFWIAREGDAIVGLSLLLYPPVRGLPWTAFTATSRAVRGRGIARALKYESMAQAIELGHERVRTANDGANAPILHINKTMGYHLVSPVIELHRSLEQNGVRGAPDSS
ncbi:MAG: GNAT family N-acetyltransferase [Candidatus Dormibacteraceae bacterium]